MDPNLVGVIIGAAGVMLAWYGGRQSERAAASQQRLGAHQSAAEWQRDLREWASTAIDVLAEASYVCGAADDSKTDCEDQVLSLRHRLSALVDRGRLFLPNQQADVGQDKPGAYRGWRHAALDPLVAAERVLSGKVGSGGFKHREAALIAMRREFVSSIQRILAPDVHNREIAKLILEAHTTRATDPTLGGLLPSSTAVPTGADRLLRGPADRHPDTP